MLINIKYSVSSPTLGYGGLSIVNSIDIESLLSTLNQDGYGERSIFDES